MNDLVHDPIKAKILVSSLSNFPEYAAIPASITTMKGGEASLNYVSMKFLQMQETPKSLSKNKGMIDPNVGTLATSIGHGTPELKRNESPKSGIRCYNCGKLGLIVRQCKTEN